MFLKANQYSKPYFESFLIAIILIWLPSKMLGYIVPFICIGWFVVRSNSGTSFLRLLSALIGLCLLIIFYWGYYTFTAGSYMVYASILSVITYASFLYILIVPSKLVLDEKQYLRFMKVIKYVVIFEGSIGILQYIAALILRSDLAFSKGDVVQGTIYPLAFLETGDMGIGNQIFAINMSVMLVFFIPYVIKYKQGKIALLIGVLAFLVTVASHIILSLVIAVLIIWIIFQKISFRLRKGTVLIAIMIFFSFFIVNKINPNSFHLLTYYWGKYTEFKSLKIVATIDAFNNIPKEYPSSVFIGLGPGQYTSRAGLIASGRYLGGGYDKPKKIPLFPIQLSQPFKKFGLATFREYLSNPTYGSSTMSRPFYSILSIISEFGLVFFFILMFLIYISINRLKLFYRNNLKSALSLDSYYLFACAATILFFIILSFFENYLEVPQAVMPGLILLRLFYSSFTSRQNTV